MTELQAHFERWKDCRDCPLCEGRQQVVFARGDAVPADVLFIGEAPGESEDALGVPFKGPAGKLLDHIVDRAGLNDPFEAVRVGLDGVERKVRRRLTKCFTNLVCCIPREDGLRKAKPLPNEIKACRTRLIEFVRLVRPRLIVLVGDVAEKNVSGASMFRLDGESKQPEWIADGDHLRFCDIVHPSFILRSEDVMQETLARRCGDALRDAVEEVFG